MNRIVFIVRNTDTGLSAHAQDYPIAAKGKNFDELEVNMLESAKIYFDKPQVKIFAVVEC